MRIRQTIGKDKDGDVRNRRSGTRVRMLRVMAIRLRYGAGRTTRTWMR
ncbi:MAG: hypothetical protein CHKLHMKO_00437 [Candidatus Argoarchaeum ethanivorans]|uniref:Uncharacterized protein n=1 Tax=Candidatus Argoarchaeum ethanivorans TaxID=2608793 RepID=A0A811TER5_9EURY|nr:MAG: hypothetical protein CHKLHMKO_00437 [Candidatus Argoarchaeum ethanivorans]